MKIHSLFLAATGTVLLMGSCKNRNDASAEVTTPADTSQIDTTVTANDSIMEEQDTVAPPKKADEFFDDFAFAFMKNLSIAIHSRWTNKVYSSQCLEV